MSHDPVVCLNNVSFGYDRELVLEGANLDVERGELMSIVGPNGSGKSTLLKLILGAVRPTTGHVRVLGQSPTQVRHRVGYMPQSLQYDPQFPVTVRDVVLMGRLGARGGGRYRKTDKFAAADAMDQVSVSDLSGRRFADLSGGQRQRVLIARALACEPELLLLDEPTANVDAAVESRFYETLAELKDRMTILMVSHDLRFVSSIVSKVICIGRHVEVHPTGEITPEVIRSLYGSDLKLVRHDHHQPASEHNHG